MALAVGTITSKSVSGTDINFAHNNNGTFLAVCITANDSNQHNHPTTSVTFGGQNLTQVASADLGNGQDSRSEIWILQNAPIGIYAVNVAGGSPFLNFFGATAVSFTGGATIGQPDSTTSIVGASGNVLINQLVSNDNTFFLDCLMSETTATVGGSQTQQATLTGQSFQKMYVSTRGPNTPIGSFSMSWTGTTVWAYCNIAIIPLTTPSVPGSPPPIATVTPVVLSPAIEKRFYYKVYDVNQRYVTTWSSDVISNPAFRTVLNGGPGELQLKLARTVDNFGEGQDVTLQNRIELWVGDKDNLSNNAVADTLWDVFSWDNGVWDSNIRSFIKIYSGFISAYSPIVDDENQYIKVTVLGYTAETSYRILKDSSGNSTVTYTNQDPGLVLRDVIDKYRADGGTNIRYLGNSIQQTGSKITYTFNQNTLKECFDTVVSMCPDGWYWFMDANGVVYLQASSKVLPDHLVTIGRDLSYYEINKRIENMVNKVYVQGGGTPPLFNSYARNASISTYGKFEKKIQDGKVTTNSTADLIAKRALDQNSTPEVRTVLRVIDNNGENSSFGQNIESYRVGDTIQVKNLKYGTKGKTLWNQFFWDVDVWDSTLSYVAADVLVIVSIQYYPDYIEIEAASRLPEITRRIEDVNSTLNTNFQANLPTAPVARVI